ncbi:putative cellulase [Medicago truncatula]|uniref:Endoglucanase n=1 Tax=Medicago truncatula TaxID=3880 RepID=A0A396JUG3_MEDTR|nr:putative cellulase [Medicago truncatula]
MLVDLVGGYYDAGDNLKLGFPMAFTITMLSWSTIEFKDKLEKTNEYKNALSAIKWGADYLMKAHPQPNILYGEVGDPDSDHQCWQRPEDMSTPRNSYKIDEEHRGTDLAAETAAAMAAASIALLSEGSDYIISLHNHAKQLFDFANNSRGLYHDSIPPAAKVYSSSGFKEKTPGGLLWFQPWTNIQYVSTATFAMATYSKYLSKKQATLKCSEGDVSPSDLTSLVQSQMDYILGSNPRNMSYMVGYGSNYPKQIHHRGSSIVSIKDDNAPVTCQDGIQKWFNKNAPNPNILEGAVVSSDQNDGFTDSRNDFQLGEPTTTSVAPLVGVLA